MEHKKTQMKVAYVIGPYRGQTHNEVAENIAAARDVAAHLWSLGYAALCPHLNSAFMSGVAPEQTFLDGTLEMLRRCDLVVMVRGWTDSMGSVYEFEEAGSLGIPVYTDIDSVPPADDFERACANG